MANSDELNRAASRVPSQTKRVDLDVGGGVRFDVDITKVAPDALPSTKRSDTAGFDADGLLPARAEGGGKPVVTDVPLGDPAPGAWA